MTTIKESIILGAEHFVNNSIVVSVSLPTAGEDLLPRKLRISPRAGWKAAFDEADAKDEATNIPRFLIRVDNFIVKKENYNGTGALWMRSDTYNNGTFQWRDERYDVSLTTVELEGKNALVFSIETVVVEDMLAGFGDLVTAPAPELV